MGVGILGNRVVEEFLKKRLLEEDEGYKGKKYSRLRGVACVRISRMGDGALGFPLPLSTPGIL